MVLTNFTDKDAIADWKKSRKRPTLSIRWSVGRPVGRPFGQSITFYFYVFIILWPHCSFPNGRVTVNTAPVHLCMTGAAVYVSGLVFCSRTSHGHPLFIHSSVYPLVHHTQIGRWENLRLMYYGRGCVSDINYHCFSIMQRWPQVYPDLWLWLYKRLCPSITFTTVIGRVSGLSFLARPVHNGGGGKSKV